MTDSSESDDQRQHSLLKDQVLNCISLVQSSGSFATSGSYQYFPLPGIHVDTVGTIGLPLSLNDAKSLIKVSRPTPFGKGSQTLLNEEVRKTWEIDGSKVSFRNEAWQGWLGGVVANAAKELGVAGHPSSVQAELYKMLLYEKGAMFKPHKE
jgi:hypothetical protein